MRLYVGASGYGYKAWKGQFYPPEIPAGKMLGFYSGLFNAVEINNTYYRMPIERVLLSWAEQVPEDFIFTFKAPQIITHLKRLRMVEEETAYLFKTLSVLGQRLGPVLFQFPRNFHIDPVVFGDFLRLLPERVECAFGFKSPSAPDPRVLDLLRANGCSYCTIDSDENPAREIITTAKWGYLRLRRARYGDHVLSSWTKRIQSTGWEKGFVFFKHEEAPEGPEDALRFRKLLGSDHKP
ncbi:MAG TPA: DUF72 domain-containing protein [Syntrophorhabdaceae bacterium]|jgi:uncharacterized protein YecE (DUF72 family)